jgi:heme exporter protein A
LTDDPRQSFDPNEADLVAEDLACRRGERLIFAGVSCRLAAGGALVVTGANGSGKSSLLRLFATLLQPAAGVLAWGSAPVQRDVAEYRARLHYVGHLDAVKPALTPREMLSFWSASRGIAPMPCAVEAALDGFALAAVADWPCRWLSAGQRRRLALARLLAAPAPVWLLDEPTTGLDRDAARRLEAAIARHRAAGGRILVATHQALSLPGAAALGVEDFSPPTGTELAEFA